MKTEVLETRRSTHRAGSFQRSRVAEGHRGLGLSPVLFSVFLGSLSLQAADRCADARDDIRRAQQLAAGGQETQARTLLPSAFMACSVNPQNLDLLAETYDSLGDLARAGIHREQAMRLRGISAKPSVNITSPKSSIERGQTATLNWTTNYATEVEIIPDLGRVPAHGTKTVAPTSTETYKLTAHGPGGKATSSVQITVIIPRLTESDILDLLANYVPKARIVRFVGDRGIAFEFTAEVEQRLRSAGADDTVVEAVRKARH